MIVKYKYSKGKRIVKTCERCGSDFNTLKAKVDRGEEKFCSRVCYDKTRTINKQDRKIAHALYQKKLNYGLSKEQYFELYAKQKNRCAICGIHESEVPDKIKKLCVDHCHVSGKVRGLLCNSCNKLLGHAKDKIKTLTKAIAYLGSSSNGKDTTLIQS